MNNTFANLIDERIICQCTKMCLIDFRVKKVVFSRGDPQINSNYFLQLKKNLFENIKQEENLQQEQTQTQKQNQKQKQKQKEKQKEKHSTTFTSLSFNNTKFIKIKSNPNSALFPHKKPEKKVLSYHIVQLDYLFGFLKNPQTLMLFIQI
ncbi:signal transducer and activator of transcription a-related [Anaeramoeba flamelloides]|uniref:Signal transducer and activator of transcription a-related n=1 Tax=Anaeramoeba flamelloides TaxID=1746091 RepID=A0AAV7Z4Q9_9EUKA|nr:signal transducer and activator of transcription a-related [Anaeramoeba flamelloides]